MDSHNANMALEPRSLSSMLKDAVVGFVCFLLWDALRV